LIVKSIQRFQNTYNFYKECARFSVGRLSGSAPKRKMNASELPEYLTPLEFAAVTHSHKRSVLTAIATGRIRCERLGHHTLMIPASEISKIHRRGTKHSNTVFQKR
jgi:hypothetical protein